MATFVWMGSIFAATLISLALITAGRVILIVYLATFLATYCGMNYFLVHSDTKRINLPCDWIVNLLDHFLQPIWRKKVAALKMESQLEAGQMPMEEIECRDTLCSRQLIREIDGFVATLTEEYIHSWHDVLSPFDCEFADECQSTLKSMFCKLIDGHLLKLNGELVSQFALNLIHFHVSDGSDELAKNVTSNENAVLSCLVNRLMNLTAPDFVKDLRQHHRTREKRSDKIDSVHLIVDNLVKEAVFLPIIDLISNPKWLNYQIVSYCLKQDDPSDETGNNFVSPKLASTKVRRPSAVSMISFSCETRGTPMSGDDFGSKGVRRSLKISRSNPSLFHQTSQDSPIIRHHRAMSADYSEYFEFMKESGIEVGNESPSTSVSNNLTDGCMEVTDEVDLKLFSNIRIVKAREVSPRNGSDYVSYQITYDAVFEEISHSLIDGEEVISHLVKKEMSVERRFSEFTALQERLDNRNHLRKPLKGIKKPSSIKYSTQSIFSNRLDKTTIEFRRAFLEQYLIELSKKSTIADSPDFQQFLAYGTDKGMTYRIGNKLKQQNLAPLRLDRLLFKGFKSAISVLKTALPIDTFEEGKFDFTHGPPVAENSRSVRIKSTKYINFGYGDVLQIDKILLVNEVESIIDFHDSKTKSNGDVYFLGPRIDGDGCDNVVNNRPEGESSEVITSESNSDVIVDAIVAAFSDNSKNSESILLILAKVMFGQVIQRISQKLSSLLLNKESLTICLNKLEESLHSTSKFDAEVDNYSIEDVTVAICSYFNNSISKTCIKSCVDQFQNQQRNKFLIYIFLYYIFDQMSN